jgi:hypothetical protein
MVCLGNMCMDTLHKGDNDDTIIIIIKFVGIRIETRKKGHTENSNLLL